MTQRIAIGKRGPCRRVSLDVKPDVSRVLQSKFDTPIADGCLTNRIVTRVRAHLPYLYVRSIGIRSQLPRCFSS